MKKTILTLAVWTWALLLIQGTASAQGKCVITDETEDIRKTFSTGSGKSGGWEEFRNSRPLSGGMTTLSRPGFDSSRTKAVLEVGHQADYEMGVGYRVYLEKSPQTGQWVIVGADVTRRS
jgi:hypothetical protein